MQYVPTNVCVASEGLQWGENGGGGGGGGGCVSIYKANLRNPPSPPPHVEDVLPIDPYHNT